MKQPLTFLNKWPRQFRRSMTMTHVAFLKKTDLPTNIEVLLIDCCHAHTYYLGDENEKCMSKVT